MLKKLRVSKMSLIKMIAVATENKPKASDECNHCGWCCITEVCSVGKGLGGGDIAPCKLMQSDGDKHYCSLMVKAPDVFCDLIGAGSGCDAMTQSEVIEAYNKGEL